MPPTPQEIGDILRDANSGLRDRIIRNLGSFTVAMLAVSGEDRLELAGTGSLMAIGGAHYILTARHVWEERLRDAEHLGITIRPNLVHRYGIPIRDVMAIGLPKPGIWNEWGPDLVLLRIPGEHVGTIQAFHCSFWNPSRLIENGDVLEVLVLMGTPIERGTIIDSHANLEITGMYLGPEAAQLKGDFDYLDYEMDLGFPGVPRTFGGVSGGGVWRVWLFWSPENREIDWKMSFHGVAFWQHDIVNEHRSIRCHGPKSVEAVMRELN
ncbi:MAG TPA: hypothetical protein VGF20_09320 [Candidatus Acidoferrum sp.]|jgi:hypothetical protein